MQKGYLSQQEAASRLGCSEEIVAQLRKLKLLSGRMVNQKLILLETSVNLFVRTKSYIDGSEGTKLIEVERPLLKDRERIVITSLLEGASCEQIGETLLLTKERIRQIAEKALAKVENAGNDGASSTIEYLVRENASLRNTIHNLQAIIAGYEHRFGKE
ncbi:MAG: hypothetical protein K6G32_12045 [Prevotella sp.]|nr:hypothetical protein [Prevotella sp.]